MKFTLKKSFLLLLLINFSSCEKIPFAPDLKDLAIDKNATIEKSGIDTLDEPKESKTVQIVKPAPPPQEPANPVQVPIPQSPPKFVETKPEAPQFSKELLAAVKNWTKVPKSQFYGTVICSSPVTLVAKTSSGQEIGSSLTPAGSELKVLGMKGSNLIVANVNNDRLRGEVDIDSTDFKELLAYRFELGKKQIVEQQRRKEEARSVINKSETKQENVPAIGVMDSTPDPLDFGHGRFCICKDCREKRLKKTGSLKTGFGLEP